jgi:PPK2 family polyphosphate:nucleotide phosphotransferase
VKLKIDLSQFRISGDKKSKRVTLTERPTQIDRLYKDKPHYGELIDQFRSEIDELQEMMYAQDRYAMLLIFQAMDAGGKDSTIKHVLRGVNPHGIHIHSFKKPTQTELDHDYMWRTNYRLPARGRIGIFNRSYYEEVLITKVNPHILTDVQRLPKETTGDLGKLFAKRYEDIRNLESYCHANGIRIAKFFLHVSKEEQKRRFLRRIDRPDKNWKFNEADVAERAFWDDYMKAYDEAIHQTTTDDCPWYVIPADDKKNMRLLVSKAVLAEMQRMHLHYPQLPEGQKEVLERCREALLAED